MSLPTAAPLSLLLVTACVVPTTTLDEEHDGDIYPTFRTTVDVMEREGPGQSAPVQVELQVSRADDRANVVDYEMLEVQTALRGNVIRTDQHTLSVLAGAGYERDTFHLGSPYSGSADSGHGGLLLGLRYGFRLVPSVELYARAQFLGYLLEEGNSDQAELGASVSITEHIGAFVAWRQWNLTSKGSIGSSSIDKIELETQGLAFGLELAF